MLVSQERKQLLGELKEKELAHRHSEFARARAEALATARGEALMHAQAALREAEGQRAQLAEALKQALGQLGVELATPGSKPLISPSGILVGDSAAALTPQPLAGSLDASQVSQHLAAVVTASQQVTAAGSHASDHVAGDEQRRQQRRQQQAAREAEAPRTTNGQQRLASSQQLEHRGEERWAGRRRSTQSAPTGRATNSQELSGFTVYSNGLSPDCSGGCALPPLAEELDDDLGRSGVPWRDISTAASASVSLSGDEEWAAAATAQGRQRRSADGAPAGVGEAQVRASRPVHHGSQDNSGEAVAASAGHAAGRRQAHAARLARLVLPHLEASQLDSLVRIGASLQSPADPDPDALSPEALQEMLPPVVWESGVAPEELLHHLRVEAAAGVAAADCVPGDARGGVEGDGPYSPEVPGAGTWVSPTLSAQLAAKARAHATALDGEAASAEGGVGPSPPTHIKAVRQAVFHGGMEFYNALGGGMEGMGSWFLRVLRGSGDLRAKLLLAWLSGHLLTATLFMAVGLKGTNGVDQGPAAQQPQRPSSAPQHVAAGMQARRADLLRQSAGLPPVPRASGGSHRRGSGDRLPPLHVRQNGESLARVFQPMGAAQAQAQQGEVEGARPRRAAADENRASVAERPLQQLPLGKRSLDSINDSLDKAMAALAPRAAAGSQARQGAGGRQVQHVRGASMPPAALVDSGNWRHGDAVAQQRASHW